MTAQASDLRTNASTTSPSQSMGTGFSSTGCGRAV